MAKRIIIPLIFIFTLCSLPGIAQKYLLMSKTNSKRRYEVFPGQSLRFKLEGDKDYQQSQIRGLGDDEIYFLADTVKLSDIRVIDIRNIDPINGISWNRWGTAFITSGVLLLFFDGFNDAVLADEGVDIDEGIWIASGSFVAAGIIMKLLYKRKFKVYQKNCQLQIIEF